jgi:hypothetical protein
MCRSFFNLGPGRTIRERIVSEETARVMQTDDAFNRPSGLASIAWRSRID